MAAALAVVVLVTPAIGLGKSEAVSLVWRQGSATFTSYNFGPVAAGSSWSTRFLVRNTGMTASGKLVVTLTGSTAFSITSNGCRGKSLLPKKSCPVTVAYAPSAVGNSDSAVLKATRPNGTAANLSLSGNSAGPFGHLYWSNQVGRTVSEVPVGGGSVTTLASGQSVPYSVAVDGTHVYWANAGDGTVKKVSLGGGSVTTLASGQDGARSVAVDGTHVYWVNRGDGTVNEVPLGGGSVTTLASGQQGPGSLAVDGTNIYWGNYGDGTVNKVPIGGGSVTTLASGQQAPGSLAIGP